jgi:hypothetical protein
VPSASGPAGRSARFEGVARDVVARPGGIPGAGRADRALWPPGSPSSDIRRLDAHHRRGRSRRERWGGALEDAEMSGGPSGIGRRGASECRGESIQLRASAGSTDASASLTALRCRRSDARKIMTVVLLARSCHCLWEAGPVSTRHQPRLSPRQRNYQPCGHLD